MSTVGVSKKKKKKKTEKEEKVLFSVSPLPTLYFRLLSIIFLMLYSANTANIVKSAQYDSDPLLLHSNNHKNDVMLMPKAGVKMSWN